MNNFKRLLKECEMLKKRIKELESKKVSEIQKTIKEIQLETLKNQLSAVGRQLQNMSLYRRQND